MNLELVIASGSALALGHCFFLCVYCWRAGERHRSFRWLALLLAGLAVRLSKSVILVLFPDSPYLIPAVGLVGTLTIGPCLWFYVRSLHRPTTASSFSVFIWAHFVPALLVAIGQLFGPSDGTVFWLYTFANLHLGVYLAAAVGWALSHKPAADPVWLRSLFGAVGLLLVVFCIHLFTESHGVYVLTTVAASFVLYGLSFWAMNRRLLPKAIRITQQPDTWQIIGRQIEQRLNEEKIFTDSTLTVQKLAGQLGLPPYRLSKIVNQHFCKTFPELLLEYRLAEAGRLLASSAHRHLTVEAIAYDSGFNSPSVFYTAFKRKNGLTPAEFQRQFADRSRSSATESRTNVLRIHESE